MSRAIVVVRDDTRLRAGAGGLDQPLDPLANRRKMHHAQLRFAVQQDQVKAIPASNREALLASSIVACAAVVAVGIAALLNTYAWLVTFVIGAALAGYGTHALRSARSVKNWPQVKGRILAASVGEVFVPGKFGGYTEYYPQVRVEYPSSRGLTVASTYSASPKDYRAQERKDIERILDQYHPGESITLYVCPQDRSIAAVNAEISSYRRGHYRALVVGGSLVATVSVLLGVFVAL